MSPASQLSVPLPINAAASNSDSVSVDQWFSNMASLLIYIAAATVIISGTIFFLLRRYAKNIKPETVPLGIIKKAVRRYFNQSILVGFLVILIACPVIFFFLYNILWLVLFMIPSAERGLSRIASTNAEHIYFSSLKVIGSWLIVILFLPAFWLLARGLRLRLRYTIENPTMNVIFKRSIKLFSIGLFGYMGCTVMHLMAASLVRFATLLIVK